MTIELMIAGGMLCIAAVLTIVRLVRGPGPVARVVATDVLIAIVVAALAIEAATNRHSFTVPIMLVLALLAFSGTVSMARFVAGRADLFGDGAAPEPVEDAEAVEHPDATDPAHAVEPAEATEPSDDSTGEARA